MESDNEKQAQISGAAVEAQPFRPHGFSPLVQLLANKVPQVLISVEAYKRMCLYVQTSSMEVGWFGTVTRTASGDFLIEETYLLEQEIADDTTSLSVDGQAQLYLELCSQGEAGLQKVGRLRFWGHSHARYECSPSRQDDLTMRDFRSQDVPWFIRGIFNKFGKAQFTIYLFDQGIRIHDAPWSVWNPETGEMVRQTSLDSEPGADTPADLLVISDELRGIVQSEFDAKVTESAEPYAAEGDEDEQYEPAGPISGDDFESDGLAS